MTQKCYISYGCLCVCYIYTISLLHIWHGIRTMHWLIRALSVLNDNSLEIIGSDFVGRIINVLHTFSILLMSFAIFFFFWLLIHVCSIVTEWYEYIKLYEGKVVYSIWNVQTPTFWELQVSIIVHKRNKKNRRFLWVSFELRTVNAVFRP